jgi:hypothetical protein
MGFLFLHKQKFSPIFNIYSEFTWKQPKARREIGGIKPFSGEA